MSEKFFIDLYLDEDVDVLVASLLQARGYNARTALQVNALGCSDREQLEQAIAFEAALLTHNRVDFERQAVEFFNANRNHHGIFIATRRRPQEIVRRLLVILDSTTAQEMKNQLLYI